jgi:predicted RNA-binding protein with PUA-like domain
LVQDADKAAQAGLDSKAVAHVQPLFLFPTAFSSRIFQFHLRYQLRDQMSYWLMKSEPDDASIDDVLAMSKQTIAWYGVRNYQARNFMRDAMQVGDGVLFYHSGCAVPGIAGLAEVASTPYPDDTQFDPKSKYFDPKAERENPRWMLVDVRALKKTRLIALPELRQQEALAEMQILRRGNRLSITPVSAAEWRYITTKLMKG